MNIFEYALQMEKESEDFYSRLAGDTNNEGFKSIFNMLAAEEAKHYEIVKEMKTKVPQKISETNILSQAKAVFEQMSKSDKKYYLRTNQIDVYRNAQEIEKKSEGFYLKKAAEAVTGNQEEIFKKLAGEESRHYFLLKNIIDFVSRPETWLENAEWNHLDEY